MRIIPAIDIIEGKCVRLTKGDFNDKTVYDSNPLDVAKMFNYKIKFLPPRPGERFASALTNFSHNNKVIKCYGKINLKDYISSFINK